MRSIKNGFALGLFFFALALAACAGANGDTPPEAGAPTGTAASCGDAGATE